MLKNKATQAKLESANYLATQTKQCVDTSLCEYRVLNLYFIPQEGGRLEFIIGLGFTKGRLKLILGR